MTVEDAVDAYSAPLTRISAPSLNVARRYLAAAANDNYAIFAGGTGGSVATAYDKTLTRSIPSALSKPRAYLAAARAGNYVVFAGGDTTWSETVDAYDLFLTRTTPEVLSAGRYRLAGTTINGKKVAGFGGRQGPRGEKGLQGNPGQDGAGLPTDGTAGQFLGKRSDTDFDYQWINIPLVKVTQDEYDAMETHAPGTFYLIPEE